MLNAGDLLNKRRSWWDCRTTGRQSPCWCLSFSALRQAQDKRVWPNYVRGEHAEPQAFDHFAGGFLPDPSTGSGQTVLA